jgi:hypothetical protein
MARRKQPPGARRLVGDLLTIAGVLVLGLVVLLVAFLVLYFALGLNNVELVPFD